jgi:hypothetical protein
MSTDTYKPTFDQCRKSFAIVPNDILDLSPFHARTIHVGVSGDLVVIPAGNDDASPVTFKAVAAGRFDTVAVRRVLATGTTATNLVANV